MAKIEAIKAQLEQLSRKSPNIGLNVDAAMAEAKLASIDVALDKFGTKNVTAKAKVDTGDSAGKLAVLGGLLNKFAKRSGDSGNNAGKGFGNSFIAGLGKSALMQNPGITALVIAGLGALPAAVGVVGVLGGVALGAGIMVGAIALLKSQQGTLQTALTKALSTAKANPKNAGAQQQVASDRAQLAQLNAELAAYNKVTGAVKNLKQSFLDFAVVASKPLITPFANAINTLSNQLGPSGALRKNFTDLFKAIAPLVKPVETALLEIINGILPSMTQMLRAAKGPLSDLFTTFGKIVGLKVGQWFRDAIPYIKDSAKYFNNLISILGSVGSFLIKFGGQVAKAFNSTDFSGFGGLINDIGNDLTKILIPAFEGWVKVMLPVIKALLEIIAPILDFLAQQPGLVKALAEIAAAYLIVQKAAELTALVMDSSLGVWGLVAIAVVVATVLIIKHWGPISAFFISVWKKIMSGFINPLINFFTNTVPRAFNVTLTWIQKHWPLLASIIGGPLGAVVTLFVTHWNTIFNFVKGIVGKIENSITGVFKPMVSVVGGILNETYKIFVDVWHGIYVVIRPIILIIIGLVGELVIGVRNAFNAVWPYVYNLTKSIWGHIENTITGIVKPIVSLVVGSWNTIKGITNTTWSWLSQATTNTWGHIENVITGIVKPLVSFLVSSWNTVKSITNTIWNWISAFLANTWHHIYNVILGIVKPMVSVVIGAWNNLKTNTENAFNTIYHLITQPLQKAWDWVTKTFVGGIENAFRGLIKTVQAIWNGLTAVVKKPVNLVIDIWNGFAKFVDAGLTIFGVTKQLPDNVKHFATGGQVPGYAPGRDIVPAMLSPGEFVMRPEAVKMIGVSNLHALNNAGGNPTFANGGAIPGFANGGTPPHASRANQNNNPQGAANILGFAESFNGHPYRWGGPSNPQGGWDCSSFAGYVLGHFGLKLPGGVSWNPSVHGPVAASYNQTPGWNSVSHNTNDILPGDLLVENSGGHVGFGVGPNRMFSAYDTAMGTVFTNAANMTNIYRLGGQTNLGPGSNPLSLIGSVLSNLANVALTGIENLATAGLGKIPGKGPFHDLPIAVVRKLIDAAKNKLTGNPNNYVQTGGVGGVPGGNPGVGTSGSEMQNGTQLFNYLKSNLFGGNSTAAAGATASIWGESTWNPFAQGTGGRGLIGWTPPSTISDAAFQGGMATQLPAIIDFVNRNGDIGVIHQMEGASSILEAANEWGHGVERFGINDVHSTGLALAAQIAAGGGSTTNQGQSIVTAHTAHKANGGLIGFANGGLVGQIQSKLAQVTQEKNTVASLSKIKKPTSSQQLSLKNDKVKLALYQSQLGKLEGTSAANAEAAAKAKIAAAAAKATAAKNAKLKAADDARIQKLGLSHSHSWLTGTAGNVAKAMNGFAARGNVTAYMGADGYYKDLEAAISRYPTQQNAEIDVLTSLRNSAQSKANQALAKGDFRHYMQFNQQVTGRNAEIQKLNAQLNGPAAGAPVDPSTLTPIEKVAYTLGTKDSKLWSSLSNQLKNDSLNPAAVGSLSRANMSSLALNVTPSVLDLLYAGPSGANWQDLAAALKGDLFNGSGITGQGSGAELALLGKLTGQHGIYAGKKFRLGGMLPAGPGFGVAGGVPFSFNEGGNREKIVPAHVQTPGESGMTANQAERLISSVQHLIQVTMQGNQQTNKNLGSVGRGLL